MRFVLASSSPARLETLRRAGIDAEVLVPGVDEDQVTAPSPAALTARLAQLKAEAVLQLLDDDPGPFVLVACDSLLELDGAAHGKPGSVAAAVERWKLMRGRQGILHTGHQVFVRDDRGQRGANRIASTQVRFADLSDAEIDAYAASGEPTRVAGAFTIDSLGGAFVTSIAGDPHNVIGISLPLLRQVLIDLGVGWHQLWRPGTTDHRV